MDWIDRAQDTDWWQARVNVVINLWVPQNSGNSWTSYFSKKTSSTGVVSWLVGWLVIIIPITRSTTYSLQNAQNNINQDFRVLEPRGGVLRNGAKLRTLPRHYIELGGMVSLGTDHMCSHIHSRREEGYSRANVEVTEPLWNRTRPIYPLRTKATVRMAV
jgi:hypothetical protein